MKNLTKIKKFWYLDSNDFKNHKDKVSDVKKLIEKEFQIEKHQFAKKKHQFTSNELNHRNTTD